MKAVILSARDSIGTAVESRAGQRRNHLPNACSVSTREPSGGNQDIVIDVKSSAHALDANTSLGRIADSFPAIRCPSATCRIHGDKVSQSTFAFPFNGAGAYRLGGTRVTIGSTAPWVLRRLPPGIGEVVIESDPRSVCFSSRQQEMDWSP